MNTQDVLRLGMQYIDELPGHTLNVINLEKPASKREASDLAKTISKLSPLIGNMIEFRICHYLNDSFRASGDDFFGEWLRQDPGFPDTIFYGMVHPTPGFEIKAWFPLSTEITARFKDSQNHFLDDQTYVAMLAWLPENIIFGKPKLIDAAFFSGASIAKARDDHYHNAPDYIVMEPENTSRRTANLQQTNTGGYKFQGTREQFIEAQRFVEKHNIGKGTYSTRPEYQSLLRDLSSMYPYRPDTNFAKMDRIKHPGVEDFKESVNSRVVHGLTIREWNQLLSRGTDEQLRDKLSSIFDI